MAKNPPGKRGTPADDDVLYLDADGGTSDESLDDILKQAQESADRIAQKQRASRDAKGDGEVTTSSAEPEEIIEEIVIEEPTGAPPASAPGPASAASPSALGRRVAELEDENAKLKAELEEFRDGLRRKQAEFENFRKRMQRDKEEFQKYAHGDLLKDLLPVLDNFERAMMVDSQADLESLRQGVELTFRQLRDALSRFGLKEIVSIGQEFDPNVHEAVASEPSSELPPNTVISELQKGYQHHDRLLRAACVKVATASGG